MTTLLINKPRKKSSDDALIPLINIVFLLLIFFMVSGSIQPSIPVEIKHAVVPEIDDPIQALTIQIVLTANNELYINDVLTSLEQVTQSLSTTAPDHINLHVDSTVTAINLEPVLNVIRLNKQTTIHLITQQQGQG